MSTSGQTALSTSRNELIKTSLRLIGAYASGETPTASEVVDASQALNWMAKAWTAQGINLWREDEGVLFLSPSQERYQIGEGTTDHAAAEYVALTLNADAESGDVALTFVSTAGVTDGDKIGVALDSGSLFWTTVESVDSSTGLTLTAPLTGSVASGRASFTYTNDLAKTPRILTARLRLWNSGKPNDIPIFNGSIESYQQIVSKYVQGKTNQIVYVPKRTHGLLYTWPTCLDCQDVIAFTFERSLEYFTSSTDEPDFPAEWFECLKYNLAIRLAHEFGRPVEKDVAAMAQITLDQALSFDREAGPIQFQYDKHGWNARA